MGGSAVWGKYYGYWRDTEAILPPIVPHYETDEGGR